MLAELAKSQVGKARPKVWLLNLAYDFPDEWAAFIAALRRAAARP